MITHSNERVFTPKAYCSTLNDKEPLDIYEAMENPLWKSVVQEEMDVLMKNGTSSLLPSP